MGLEVLTRKRSSEQLWESSFQAQIDRNAYNTAPVEALVRTVSHYFRSKELIFGNDEQLKFLEVGCGAGANLGWLAERGIEANGVDISPTAIELCRKLFTKRALEKKLGKLIHGCVTELEFEDQTFDGVIESCVFQHLQSEDRIKAHAEVVRVLKPGALFVGHMLSQNHSTFQRYRGTTEEIEPGTLFLSRGDLEDKIMLEDIGLAHFFAKQEFMALLEGCSIIDPCESTYELPREEANRRGYDSYRQAMWIVYAIK
ncbi:MAG: hypothetical protein CMM58_14560 [Rhodospirillaceae bacterium]|nr:hypothetical protein [Rhodospirillaceae bacterium]|tara:strand:+ start:3355 stop:4125 length:771 start_codon:yes stop_codon:yes gene_type:complete